MTTVTIIRLNKKYFQALTKPKLLNLKPIYNKEKIEKINKKKDILSPKNISATILMSTF